ncbi:MAG TPA: DUF1800 domain-containing protein [Planktothrix sp.]|jgi:uncharacterized protein (DUF1800 family)
MPSDSEDFLVEHLLRRAAFGATPEELKRYKSMGYNRTLKELLHPEKVKDKQLDQMLADQNFDFTSIEDLKHWWLYRMIYTKRPLQEKMTLFWHGHFATSNKKVGNSYAMYMQNVLFRQNGMGNFRDLLLETSKDPAMIVWLDNNSNNKGKPNENYAREIMELFALGIGNYSEQDIKEGARAFTGWQTKPNGFYFNPGQHDYGSKKFLGRTGNLNGDDVVEILSEQPACPKFISMKLCKFFASDNPSKTLVSDVAATYTGDGDNIRNMLTTLFQHDEFKSKACYHAKIKSPVELVVGTIKSLQVQKLDNDLPNSMGRMGQTLLEPPNVKGWDGGPAWISTNTMMERFNFATKITQAKFDALETFVKPAELVEQQQLQDPDQMVDYFLNILTDGDVPEQARLELRAYMTVSPKGDQVVLLSNDKVLDQKLRGLVHLIMTLPTYQLA